MFSSLAIAAMLAAAATAAERFVTPGGTPHGDGSQARPWDLATALAERDRLGPGDTVWLGGGTYRGPFRKSAQPSGTAERPIIYRAMPGQRVTLTAKDDDRSVLEIAGAEHVWFWGLEVTVGGRPELGHYGAGISLRGGREIKLINLVVHDCPNRSGIAGSNLGSEFYGCLIYRNGQWANALAHGTYTQNRPEDVGGDPDKLPWKIHRDCAVFQNFGWGVHSYGTSPRLANLLYEGVVAYGNGLPAGAAQPCPNLLAGGRKPSDNVVLRHCSTYYPERGNFKRGTDLGLSAENGRLTVQDCCFVGGQDALWLRKWQQASVTGCRFLTANGCALRLIRPAGYQPARYHFADNIYYKLASPPFGLDDAAIEDLAAWQSATGLDQSSRTIAGRPGEPWVFLRPNRYEPERALLAVYNWPRTAEVEVPLGRLWGLKPSQGYRVHNVEDIWAKPVAEGRFSADPARLKMVGAYAPEFACYLLLLDADSTPNKQSTKGKSP
jgi:hypothetical protein